jgi:hypothetical protein
MLFECPIRAEFDDQDQPSGGTFDPERYSDRIWHVFCRYIQLEILRGGSFMETEIHSHLGSLLLLIHQSITRGIQISRIYAQIFGKGGFPDTPFKQGLSDYLGSLSSVLKAHLVSEDDLAFPRFREIIPEAPYDQLQSQHRAMAALIDALSRGADDITSESANGLTLGRIGQVLTELQEIWGPHIKVEESYFTAERIDRLMGAVEQDRLAAAIARLTMEHSGPDYLVIPFTLHNLAPASRATLAEAMPPVVTRQLVPVVWREKWRNMMPFLMA